MDDDVVKKLIPKNASQFKRLYMLAEVFSPPVSLRETSEATEYQLASDVLRQLQSEGKQAR